MNKYTLLQNPLSLIQLSFRTYAKDTLKPIHYHGFTYYPRHENFKDPPYKPSKLFLIRRLRSMKGISSEERKTLEQLNIDGPVSKAIKSEEKDIIHLVITLSVLTVTAADEVVKTSSDFRAMTRYYSQKQQACNVNIVKNIPEMNALLWKVKHLIEIKPIRWTGEIPADCMGTHLRDTGELVISPKLKVSEEALEETKKFDKKKFGPGYLKAYLLEEWKKGYS